MFKNSSNLYLRKAMGPEPSIFFKESFISEPPMPGGPEPKPPMPEPPMPGGPEPKPPMPEPSPSEPSTSEPETPSPSAEPAEPEPPEPESPEPGPRGPPGPPGPRGLPGKKDLDYYRWHYHGEHSHRHSHHGDHGHRFFDKGPYRPYVAPSTVVINKNQNDNNDTQKLDDISDTQKSDDPVSTETQVLQQPAKKNKIGMIIIFVLIALILAALLYLFFRNSKK